MASATGRLTLQDESHWVELIRRNLAKTVSAEEDDNGEALRPLIDEEILEAPRRRSSPKELAHRIAARLYPSEEGSLSSIIHYEKDITDLRALVLKQRRDAILQATQHNSVTNWTRRISKQGPWDPANDPVPLTGASSLPMPVEVSDRDSLAPFFAHLSNGGTHDPASVPLSLPSNKLSTGAEPYYGTALIEFEKGVLYSDGRVDLCKMVTGPRHIGELMESLKPNHFAKHFLLGNNIIGPVGAKAIADFIVAYPERFETWYLAGNAIDRDSFHLLVDSMIESPAITNVWLKRNPLSDAAADDVYRLIANTPHLRTLDLDQTEIGDAGVTKFFEALTAHDRPLSLRHIYLNATGVGENACAAIAKYLASKSCGLQSLYLSNNPIGDRGAVALAAGVQTNKSLKRLSLQSCGLQDVTILIQALSSHPNLQMLDLGQSYATEDLGMRYNWLTDANIPSLVHLIQTSPKLKLLNLAYVPISQSRLNMLLSAVLTSLTLVSYAAKPLSNGGQDAQSVKVGQEHTRLNALVRRRLHENVRARYGVGYEEFQAQFKRLVISPEDVRLIDSVYRNRDAAAARRGEKRLEKWWREGDETLTRVMEGTFV